MRSDHPDPEVSAAVKNLLTATSDALTLQELQAMPARIGTQLIATNGSEFLFSMPPGMREDFQEYQLFFMGRLFEVRQMLDFSKYSLVNFPKEMEDRRELVQEKFAALILTTEVGLGWFAPARWDDLGEVQKSLCKPKFIEDNIRAHLM